VTYGSHFPDFEEEILTQSTDIVADLLNRAAADQFIQAANAFRMQKQSTSSSVSAS
jgi:hypothetical protein